MGFHAVKACALAALAIPASAYAQVYPAKPVRMIVAYPPGGGTDIVGRLVAQKLGESLGQSVVVENRGGASGNIGTELAARAAPDGYTILMGNVAPNAINVSLFKNLPFDPVADFAPVSLVASTPNLHAEIVKILADPALRARLADQGFEPVGNSPEEFGAYIKSEIAKWGKTIRDAGIRPE